MISKLFIGNGPTNTWTVQHSLLCTQQSSTHTLVSSQTDVNVIRQHLKVERFFISGDSFNGTSFYRVIRWKRTTGKSYLISEMSVPRDRRIIDGHHNVATCRTRQVRASSADNPATRNNDRRLSAVDIKTELGTDFCIDFHTSSPDAVLTLTPITGTPATMAIAFLSRINILLDQSINMITFFCPSLLLTAVI
jgi:hypothetical protein